MEGERVQRALAAAPRCMCVCVCIYREPSQPPDAACVCACEIAESHRSRLTACCSQTEIKKAMCENEQQMTSLMRELDLLVKEKEEQYNRELVAFRKSLRLAPASTSPQDAFL